MYEIIEGEVFFEEQNEVFTGGIKIVNSEDPDDYCIIDVSLATPISYQAQLYHFLEICSRPEYLEKIRELVTKPLDQLAVSPKYQKYPEW